MTEEKVMAQEVNEEADFITLQFDDGEDVECAILKSRSPTCGVKQVYDGTFSGTLVSGMGVLAQALQDAGIRVIDVEDLV